MLPCYRHSMHLYIDVQVYLGVKREAREEKGGGG